MTAQEAKNLLCIHRPGTDQVDPEVAEALALAERDPELKSWYQRHCALQKSLRTSLSQLPVPEDLKSRILARQTIAQPDFRPLPWLAMAAALIFIGVAVWLLRIPRDADFDSYQDRIVRNAIRQYPMDLTSHDLAEINRFLSTNGAPTDSVLPTGLTRLSPTGAGLLHWHDHPVSMLCFDRGDGQMLLLFVLDRHAVRNEPSPQPEVTQINKLMAASWTGPTNTYILAGPPEPDFVKKYLAPFGQPSPKPGTQ